MSGSRQPASGQPRASRASPEPAQSQAGQAGQADQPRASRGQADQPGPGGPGAARLDGIGPIRFLTFIVLRLARPAIAAVFVLEFIYGWNQYLWPLLVASDPQRSTVVMGIRRIISAAQSFAVPQRDLVMSVALLALIPPVLVVVAMQRWFVRGLMEGID